MRTIDECAALVRVSRATIQIRLREYDQAVAKGEEPPKGSLRSVVWRSRRLIADEWVRASLGLDATTNLGELHPREKLLARGKAFAKKAAR